MKRGTFTNTTEPLVRLIMVAPHLYQVSLRNIYGYLKTILIDRCKKTGAQYRFYQRSYFVKSDKLADLKKQFQEVLTIKSLQSNMKFRIQQFPMNQIKSIFNGNKSYLQNDKTCLQNDKSQSRVIWIDHLSLNRYFYLSNRFEPLISGFKSENHKKEKILIITSDSNKKIWFNHILKSKNIGLNVNLNVYKQLGYTQLSNKRSNLNQLTLKNQIYLIIYDNLRFLDNSWFLNGQVQNLNQIIVDDAEFLIQTQNQLSTLENKNKNMSNFKLILSKFSIFNKMSIFFSKIPQPIHLFKLLILIKPKCFGGLKFVNLNSGIFDENILTKEEKAMSQQFISWFRRRYRKQNKCFKQILYILNSTVIKVLNKKKVKQTNLASSLNIPDTINGLFKLHSLQLGPDIIQKFRGMDKKYKKLSQKINFKQIVEGFHRKTSEMMFHISSRLQDYNLSKQAKNYFLQAKQLMLNAKLQLIFRRIYFTIQVQQQRIIIIIDEQKHEKKLKNYLKQIQIQYVEYDMKNINYPIQEFQSNAISQMNNLNFPAFDKNLKIKICIINRQRIIKQYKQIKKKQNQKQNEYKQKQQQSYDGYQNSNDDYNFQINQKIIVPKITTTSSIYFIDTFWQQFDWEKQTLINQIINIQMAYIDQSKGKLVFKQQQLKQNYFISQGSYQKLLLQAYLQIRQKLPKIQYFQNQKLYSKLKSFQLSMIQKQMSKYHKYGCLTVDYLDIDDQYDKVEEQAKKMTNSKFTKMNEKVFLPKYVQPQIKSFKQMLEQKLSQKRIEQILQQSQSDQYNYQTNYNFLDKKVFHNKQIKQVNQHQQQTKSERQQKNKIKQQTNHDIQNLMNAFQGYVKSQSQVIQGSNNYSQKQVNYIIKLEPKVFKQYKIKIPLKIQIQTVKISDIKQKLIDKHNRDQNIFSSLKQQQNIQAQKLQNIFIQPKQYQGVQCNQSLDLFDQLLAQDKNANNYLKDDNNYLKNQQNQLHKHQINVNDHEKSLKRQNLKLNKLKCEQNDQLSEAETQPQQILQKNNLSIDLGNYFIQNQRKEEKINQLNKNGTINQSHYLPQIRVQNKAKSILWQQKYAQAQNQSQKLTKKRSLQILQQKKVGKSQKNLIVQKNKGQNLNIIDLDDEQLDIQSERSQILRKRQASLRINNYKNKQKAKTSLNYLNLKRNKNQFKNKESIKTHNQVFSNINANKYQQANSFQHANKFQMTNHERRFKKQDYEQAISKSKQLWQKKLRKETQSIILTQKTFQLTLKAKQGWIEELTSQQIQNLKQKGIQI